MAKMKKLQEDQESQPWDSDEEEEEDSDGEPCQALRGPRGLALAVGAIIVLCLLGGWWHMRNGGASDDVLLEKTTAETVPPEVEVPAPGMPPASAATAGTQAAETVHPAIAGGANVANASSPEHLHTAGCGPKEELLAGLCYRTCSLLTSGEFPVRWAHNTCHRDATEGRAAETKIDGIICNGYDVGDDYQCPHPPHTGVCDANEELHEDFCYRKCSILTAGEYTIRSGPNTCCQEWPCINPFRDESEGFGCQGFGVGGGMNGHDCPHSPEVVG